MRSSVLVVLVLCGVGFAQQKRESASLSSLVPPDTMVVLEFDDLGGYEHWTKETALGRIWIDPQMQQFVGGVRDAIAKAIAFQKGQGRDPLAMVGLKLTDIVGIVPRSGGIALVDLDLDNEGYPDLLVTMEVRTGVDGLKHIVEAVRMALGMFAGVEFTREAHGDIEILWAELPMGGELAYTFVGNRLLMASSRPRLKDALVRLNGGGAANLRGSPAFGRALRTMGARRTATLLYVDATRLRERMLALMAPMIGDDIDEVRRIIDAVGLDAIEQFVVADIPHDENLRTEFLIQLRERKGVFKLLQDAPTSHRFAAFTPRDPLYYAAERGDMGRYLDEGVQWVDSIMPGASEEVGRIFARYNQVLGIDIRTDLIGSLGDEWAAYVSDPPQGGLIPDMVLFASVRDKARLHKSLRALVEKYDAVLAMYGERAVRHAPKIRHRKTMFGDHAIHCIEITGPHGKPVPVLPCWTMGEDYIAFALWPHSLRNALRRKSSLATNPRFQALRAGIPQGAISTTYLDLPRVTGWAYNTIVPVLQGVQGAINRQIAQYGASVNFHDLPPAEVITRHLSPVLGYTKVEETAIRFGYVSPCGLSLSVAAPVALGAIVGLSVARIERHEEAEDRFAFAEAEELRTERRKQTTERARLERRLAELERQLEELRRSMDK